MEERAVQAHVASERLAREAEVANTSARGLAGDPEALSQCSLDGGCLFIIMLLM